MMVVSNSRKRNASVLALSVFALGAVGSSKKSAPSEKPGEEATATGPSLTIGKGATGLAKMGETITFDDSSWTVIEAKDAGKTLKSNNGYQSALKTDGKFVLVHFKLTNKGKKEERIFEGPKLRDSKMREFKSIDGESSYIPANAKSMTLEALPPSLSKEFWAAYEVAEDSTGLTFGARELDFGGTEKYIALGF